VTAFLDGLLVCVALSVSGAYVLLSLGPKTWRQRWRDRLGALAARAPASFGMRALLRRLAGGAEAGCGGCGSCADAATSAAPAPPTRPGEVRISVGRIGRRS
jgi:hypothetical protein